MQLGMEAMTDYSASPVHEFTPSTRCSQWAVTAFIEQEPFGMERCGIQKVCAKRMPRAAVAEDFIVCWCWDGLMIFCPVSIAATEFQDPSSAQLASGERCRGCFLGSSDFNPQDSVARTNFPQQGEQKEQNVGKTTHTGVKSRWQSSRTGMHLVWSFADLQRLCP